MRFRIGPPPEDGVISGQDTGWRPVREPNTLNMQILAVFMAVCVALCIGAIALLFLGPKRALEMSWPTVMLSIFLIMPIHELLHAMGLRGGVTSRKVVFGFYPKLFGFYVHYNGQIHRNRFIITAALPFLVLTAAPLAFVAGLRLDHEYLLELITANGLASSLDVLAIIVILKETPRRSVLINSGMKTYWKPMDNKEMHPTT